MGFAARLSEARSAQEAQKGPITMDQTTKMIHEAITKAVKTNKLESICTAQEVMTTAKQLGKSWDMNAFCDKYAMPPQIAADLLQVATLCRR
jgi:precorrin isomerase